MTPCWWLSTTLPQTAVHSLWPCVMNHLLEADQEISWTVWHMHWTGSSQIWYLQCSSVLSWFEKYGCSQLGYTNYLLILFKKAMNHHQHQHGCYVGTVEIPTCPATLTAAAIKDEFGRFSELAYMWIDSITAICFTLLFYICTFQVSVVYTVHSSAGSLHPFKHNFTC